jgi:hypothetical protein
MFLQLLESPSKSGRFSSVVGAVVGWWIATQKRRTEIEGAALGCLLGPVGWIIEALLPMGGAPERAQSVGSPGDLSPSPPSVGRSVPPALMLPAERPFGRGGWMSAVGERPAATRNYFDSPPEQLIEQMKRDELVTHERDGKRIVEAVWSSLSDEPRISCALGQPDRQYQLLWPDRPRVNWQSLLDAAPSRPADGTTDPTVPPAVKTTPRSDVEEVVGGPVSDVEPDQRSTKVCPDCAETVLAAARICRFCRHEFEHAAVLSSETPPVRANDDTDVLVPARVPEPAPPQLPEPQVLAPEPKPTVPYPTMPSPWHPPQPYPPQPQPTWQSPPSGPPPQQPPMVRPPEPPR